VGKVNKRLYILLFFVFAVKLLQAQTGDTQFIAHKSSSSVDTTEAFVSPAVLSNAQFTPFVAQTDSLASSSSLLEEDSMKMAKQLRREQRALQRANFKPDPNMSLWLGLTFPGAGQIYNRKYWKLPIVYGGAVGVAYAISYYGGYYNDYMRGYRDYVDSDPNTNYHLELIPAGYPTSNAGTYVKNRVNSYRRYRDIFIVVGVAVYALSVIDAYVDAQLADFDVSTDLSMKVRPKLDVEPHTGTATAGCQMQIYF
jgi:hypothetical protein